jgi:hypothetical protein
MGGECGGTNLLESGDFLLRKKPPAINNLSYTQDYGDLRTSDAFEQLWPWRPLKHILLNRPLRLLHAGRD